VSLSSPARARPYVGEAVASDKGVSTTSCLSASALRTRNLSTLALAALGCLLSAPLLIFIGVLLYCAVVAADERRLLAERLPSLTRLGDFEVRLIVRTLIDARVQAERAIAAAPSSLERELASLPPLLDEIERRARPLVEQADRLGCFLCYRARRPDLERESVQLAAEILRAPAAARPEYEAARATVVDQMRLCDELIAERERLLGALTHLTAQLRALPLAIARLELDEARLRGACDTASLEEPISAALADLRDASNLRSAVHDETLGALASH
jgi:hypothetical protein